jgi:hypothetical protein
LSDPHVDVSSDDSADDDTVAPAASWISLFVFYVSKSRHTILHEFTVAHDDICIYIYLFEWFFD